MVLAAMAALFAPSPAWAHAHLKRSFPNAEARLSVPPQLIQLWFSEQPELAATYASLKDSRGRTFALSAAEPEPSGTMGVKFRLAGVLPAGRYVVSWRTVAADGHPSPGKFRVVVLMAPAGTIGSEPAPAQAQPDSIPDAGAVTRPTTTPSEKTQSGTEDASSSIANSVARAVLFVGILALIGAISFKLFVL